MFPCTIAGLSGSSAIEREQWSWYCTPPRHAPRFDNDRNLPSYLFHHQRDGALQYCGLHRSTMKLFFEGLMLQFVAVIRHVGLSPAKRGRDGSWGAHYL